MSACAWRREHEPGPDGLCNVCFKPAHPPTDAEIAAAYRNRVQTAALADGVQLGLAETLSQKEPHAATGYRRAVLSPADLLIGKTPEVLFISNLRPAIWPRPSSSWGVVDHLLFFVRFDGNWEELIRGPINALAVNQKTHGDKNPTFLAGSLRIEIREAP